MVDNMIKEFEERLSNLKPLKGEFPGQWFETEHETIYYVDSDKKPLFFYYPKCRIGYVHQDIYDQIYKYTFNYHAEKTSRAIKKLIKKLYNLDIKFYSWEEDHSRYPFDWYKRIPSRTLKEEIYKVIDKNLIGNYDVKQKCVERIIKIAKDRLQDES